MNLTTLRDWFVAHGFGDFAGAEAFVKLPLRESFVNPVVHAVVVPQVSALRTMRLVIHPDNRLDVVLGFTSRWLPEMTVPLELDPHVAMTPSPVIRLWLRDVGVVGRLAPLATLLGDRLPPGVRIDRRTIDLDLAALSARYDTLGLLELLQQARLTTAPGVLWIEAALGVAAAKPAPAAPTPASHSPPSQGAAASSPSSSARAEPATSDRGSSSSD